MTIGDAWEFISAERDPMQKLLEEGDLTLWPQRFAAITAHVRFMESKAYFLFGKARTELEQAVQSMREARLKTAALAFSGDRGALASEWRKAEQWLDTIADLLPADSLLPTSQVAHLLPPAVATTAITLTAPLKPVPGRPLPVTFAVQQQLVKDRPPLLPEHLLELHGAQMHAFIVDQHMTDYHHLHPQPTETPGEYACTFTPKTDGQYRCWVNMVPLESGREEFPSFDLTKPDGYPIVPKDAQHNTRFAAAGGLHVTLSLSEEPAAMSLVPCSFLITDTDGRPLHDLEPYLGAFAHIVGFHDDFSTVLHLHPHGAVPKDADRGGPVIDFTLRAPLPGYYKLFLQLKHKGEVITLPFGITVPQIY